MSILLNGDCLEEMKELEDNSIDFIFCDLPYGQTSCSWDCCIDLDAFWKEIMRIKKLNTPIFFTTTTKFGVSLINSAPKKCYFRYDLVWVKSAPAGFLSAKKMPMRKHEMIYVFYEKLPLYDLSSHKHKFINDEKKVREPTDGLYGKETKKVFIYDEQGKLRNSEPRYDPPLPTSIIKGENNTYNTEGRNKPLTREPAGKYDPPLPTSVVKETINKNYGCPRVFYTDENGNKIKEGQSGKDQTKYEPPLPTSVVKEDIYGNPNRDIEEYKMCGKKGKNQVLYDPPLPTSMLEVKSTKGKHSTEKPVALMEWLLKYYSKEGDVVLDPTMGSGSTGVACKNMNRNFIGIEKDEEIYEVACERVWGD